MRRENILIGTKYVSFAFVGAALVVELREYSVRNDEDHFKEAMDVFDDAGQTLPAAREISQFGSKKRECLKLSLEEQEAYDTEDSFVQITEFDRANYSNCLENLRTEAREAEEIWNENPVYDLASPALLGAAVITFVSAKVWNRFSASPS